MDISGKRTSEKEIEVMALTQSITDREVESQRKENEMSSKRYLVISLFLMLFSVMPVVLAAPPDSSDLIDSVESETTSIASSQQDTNRPLIFTEIVISNDGTVKARTEDGQLITITPDLIDSLLPQSAQEPSSRRRAGITGWGKNVIVDEQIRVDSDIQIFSGNVTIRGTVNGDVMVVGGDIHVASTGVIRGDALAIGGSIKKEEGAKISGSAVEIRLPVRIAPRGSVYQTIQGGLIIIALMAVIWASVWLALWPEVVQRVARQIEKSLIKSFFIGYASYIGMLLLWVLLLVTIIGIPLAMVGEPVVILLVLLQGFAAGTLWIGNRLFGQATALNSFLYGCLVTALPPLGLLIIGYVTNSLTIFVINMIILGVLIFVFFPIGLGAAILAKFGLDKKTK